MTAVLPDIDELKRLTASAMHFADAIGANTINSVQLIDGGLDAIQQLIHAKQEKAVADIREIEATLNTEVDTLQGLQQALGTIRSGFVENAPEVLPMLEAKAA